MVELFSQNFKNNSNLSSDDDNEAFVVSCLQKQMRAKVAQMLKAKNVSLSEVSERTQIELSVLEKMLEQKADVSVADLQKIADAVGYFSLEE